jgi:hypothetical protein
MNTLLTFDYEVFFGPRTGTPERCLLEPTDALMRLGAKHSVPMSFFVDVGYLLALKREMRSRTALRLAHDAICRQLADLSRRGNQLHLHVHPHWEDARWENGEWKLDLARYALHSFAPEQAADIVKRYLDALRDLGGPASGTAFRAGGWVIQPFDRLRNALRSAGVKIDSTVYPGGHRGGRVQPYDFRKAPAASRWRFEHDPLVEDPRGSFLEVPIASRKVKPSFFWRLALAKKAGGRRHRPFGDGHAIPMDGGDLKEKLTRESTTVVSVDGFKASFLEEAAADYRRRGRDDFVVIGHPKSLTPYSLEKLDRFIASRKPGELVTYSAYA